MDSVLTPNPQPEVSVVIPARNEEANLERCLRSLVMQQGVPFEIIVVNDGSTDGTREIAENFVHIRECPFPVAADSLVGVRLIDAPPLPEGWTGKTNALVAGEKIARGRWILFTDADTEHLPGSLAAAVAEAKENKADLLSYSPEQLVSGVRQQLVVPLIFGELAMQYSPRRVSDPAMPDAAANGQYLMVRAAEHKKLGGFTSVAHELLEDVALARLYKQQQRTILFRLGQGLVRTRMYRTWDELQGGWTKNLALLFPAARQLATRRSTEFYKLMLSLFVALFLTWVSLLNRHAMDWLVWVAVVFFWLFTMSSWALFYLRASRAHFPAGPTLLSVLGLPLFADLLRRSADAHEKGSVNWRGRSYRVDGANRPSAASNSK